MKDDDDASPTEVSAEENTVQSDTSETSLEEEQKEEEIYFSVRAKASGLAATEQDLVQRRCQALAESFLRKRPTLPASWEDSEHSFEDTESGIRLPLFSCPFKHCTYHTDDRTAFLLHLGGVDSSHHAVIKKVCEPTTTPWLKPIDYVYGAIAVRERGQWPRLGLAVTRRTLRGVASR